MWRSCDHFPENVAPLQNSVLFLRKCYYLDDPLNRLNFFWYTFIPGQHTYLFYHLITWWRLSTDSLADSASYCIIQSLLSVLDKQSVNCRQVLKSPDSSKHVKNMICTVWVNRLRDERKNVQYGKFAHLWSTRYWTGLQPV